MPATFNSVDPRTGTPVAGYDEAGPADVAAAVDAAERAFHDPALRDRDRPRGAAARRRRRGCARPATRSSTSPGARPGCPRPRLRSELERTAGQLEAFAALLDAGDYVEAIIDTPDPGRQADPAARRAPHARPDRPGRRVRREQLPARVLDRRRRHRVGARRRLPGRRQGPPVAPGHRRARRARGPRRGRRRRAARRHVRAPARRRRRGRRGARRRARRSPPSASPARPPAAARSPTAPRAGPRRSPSTPRWARSTRSS